MRQTQRYVRCRFVSSLDCWNERHAPDKPIRVAVGIHCGEVVQGDVGTDKRLEFTVIGDTVNIASRVEAYCRTIAATVLVTGDFMQSLLAEGSFDLARAFADEGKHLLRGCKDPIQLYSLKARVWRGAAESQVHARASVGSGRDRKS